MSSRDIDDIVQSSRRLLLVAYCLQVIVKKNESQELPRRTDME